MKMMFADDPPEFNPAPNFDVPLVKQLEEWLVAAYPQRILKVEKGLIYWWDGETMPLGDRCGNSSLPALSADTEGPSVMDQFRWSYPQGLCRESLPATDPGRIRCEPFFRKMYGATREEVEANLVTVPWMPKTTKKNLRVTRINGVADRVAAISAELDKLPRALKAFVCKPGGGFYWRTIAETSWLSPHAFGMAIDINVKCGDYWRWDLTCNGDVSYRNRIPEKIVQIFERHGFIWGGKWKHYDTMHFEYRPELLMTRPTRKMRTDNILYLCRQPGLYGAQRQLDYLVKGLTPERFIPFLVYAEQSTEIEGDRTGITSKLIPLRPWSKMIHVAGRYVDALKLLKFARLQKIDLIHCSYQWLLPYALFVGKRLKVPVVAHIRRPNNSPRKLLKLGCAKADAVFAISRRINNELQSIPTLASKVYLVPDAVDLAAFQEQPSRFWRKELGVGDKILFGVVARVYQSKRQLDFVKAAKLLVDRGYDAAFVLVGRIDDNEYSDRVQDFITSQHLNDRVRCVGHRDDMAEVLSSLDVLVSLAGGSVMYEAMAIGRVVISAGFTKAEHSTHLIHEKTALVSESKNVEVLAALMERVIREPELRKKLEGSAREWARQHLSVASLVMNTEKVYDHLLS